MTETSFSGLPSQSASFLQPGAGWTVVGGSIEGVVITGPKMEAGGQ